MGIRVSVLLVGALLGCSSSAEEAAVSEGADAAAGSAVAAGGSVGTGGRAAAAGGGAGRTVDAGSGGAPGTGGSAGGSAGGTLAPPGTNTFCDGHVIYDGEPGSHPVTTASGFQVAGWPQVTKAKDVAGVAAVGNYYLQIVSDPGGTCCGTIYTSFTGWDKGPGQPVDLTGAQSLQFWIKIESGQYWNLMVEIADANGVNSFTGADVHVADYIAGKNIDGTWRQATVPLSALNTHGIDMSKISGVIFEGDRLVTYDVDQIVFCGAAP
jgi:hypothetical protein